LVLAGLWTPFAFVLAALVAGPLALALMHCAVTLAQTEELRVGEALVGVRRHWRRGLALGVAGIAAAAAGAFAVAFYAGAGPWGLPLAVLVVYLLAMVAIFQLLLWPLAVFDERTPLRVVARRTGAAVLSRPLDAAVLATVLLVVNVAGLAAAVVPFLTVTIGYSFLAAAHFSLPPNPLREVHRPWRR
jgi:hypothetical protein